MTHTQKAVQIKWNNKRRTVYCFQQDHEQGEQETRGYKKDESSAAHRKITRIRSDQQIRRAGIVDTSQLQNQFW